MDDFIQKILSKPNHSEARAWLNKHTDEYFINLGELPTNEESLALVSKFYANGAVEVVAVEIDQYPDEGENTGKLVIALPSEKEKREKVLGLCSDLAEEQGFDRLTDEGQTHVFVMLD